MLDIWLLLVLVGLFAATVGTMVYLALYVLRRQRELLGELQQRLDQTLGVSVKLLEVREYYQYMAERLRVMLKEAYDGHDRERQQRVRQMEERLEVMKQRVLDSTRGLLEPEAHPRKKRRRRKPR